jgi:hypothetical protein
VLSKLPFPFAPTGSENDKKRGHLRHGNICFNFKGAQLVVTTKTEFPLPAQILKIKIPIRLRSGTGINFRSCWCTSEFGLHIGYDDRGSYAKLLCYTAVDPISLIVYISNALSNLMVLPPEFESHICLCQCRRIVGYHCLKKPGRCE